MTGHRIVDRVQCPVDKCFYRVDGEGRCLGCKKKILVEETD